MNDYRGPDRIHFTAEAGMRRSGGHGYRVRVFDLSPQGCKIEFIERPAVGERVWVKFDTLEAIEGTVRWIDGHIGGLEFERPLHDAVFQRLVR
jgi:PilZ domain-containing protein